MLRWAIPEFRLPGEVVEREIDLLRRLGVVFNCNLTLGRDKSLQELKSAFGAVILALGCPEAVELNIEGRDLEGVHHGLPLLKAVRSGQRPDLGQRVVVISGGNVAVDAAQTALRLGAGRVSLVCLEAADELPAFPWSVESALSEGVQLKASLGPVRFRGREGKVAGVELKACLSVFDESGSFAPCFDDGQVQALEADAVIVAVGQKTGGAVSGQGEADELPLQTSDPQVFVAGDCLTGPSTVVEALAQGRRAAESVDRFLRKEHLRYNRAYPGPVETEFEIEAGPDSAGPRVALPTRVWQGAGDFQELESALDRAAAFPAVSLSASSRPAGSVCPARSNAPTKPFGLTYHIC
ncbi:MAG: FAD-dependent oxidoreductase [Deltaproteobacteria bacterium]|nr:FAD-dependent oxidoreductase [Deltaproteobacteria bacterium]